MCGGMNMDAIVLVRNLPDDFDLDGVCAEYELYKDGRAITPETKTPVLQLLQRKNECTEENGYELQEINDDYNIGIEDGYNRAIDDIYRSYSTAIEDGIKND